MQSLATLLPVVRRALSAAATTSSSSFSSAARSGASIDVRAFEADGFVIVRSLLDDQEIGLVSEALEADRTLVENQYELNDAEGGSTKLTLWSNPGDGTLGNFTRSTRVMGSMAALLGGPVVHYHSKVLAKQPQSGGVWNWHQDYGYWYKDNFLLPAMATCFLAVDHCTTENGCLKVLRGSHKLGRVDHWSKGDQQGADLERVQLATERYEEVQCELAPGDAVFFSALTLHSSQGNHSDKRRLALASCFTLADNVQFRDAYIPCVACDEVDDTALLRDGLKLTSSEDKQMLSPDVGKDAARKDEGGDFDLSESKP